MIENNLYQELKELRDKKNGMPEDEYLAKLLDIKKRAKLDLVKWKEDLDDYISPKELNDLSAVMLEAYISSDFANERKQRTKVFFILQHLKNLVKYF